MVIGQIKMKGEKSQYLVQEVVILDLKTELQVKAFMWKKIKRISMNAT